jgi:hypothetical protein
VTNFNARISLLSLILKLHIDWDEIDTLLMYDCQYILALVFSHELKVLRCQPMSALVIPLVITKGSVQV